MPLDMTGDPRPERDDDGSQTWACVGYSGVVLQVTRAVDGTLTIGTHCTEDKTSNYYGMHLSLEAGMSLVAFMVGATGEPN